jgi:hypothetical protein
MSGDGTEFEYPDQAGYPDGMGTLHEGTEDEADDDGDDEGGDDEDGDDEDGDDEDGDDEDGDDDADGFEAGLDHFAMQDEEDVDEDV